MDFITNISRLTAGNYESWESGVSSAQHAPRTFFEYSAKPFRGDACQRSKNIRYAALRSLKLDLMIKFKPAEDHCDDAYLQVRSLQGL